MASAAEQLAANLNFGALAKSEDLKKRIWFTLGALISLLVTVSDISMLNIGAAFWGLVAGFGITQVRDRLTSTYGAAAGLTIAAAPGGGTLARIHLPLAA